MKLYDISPRLHAGIAVWPGDVAYSREVSMSLAAGDSVNLSSVTMSLHTGAHADAPSHYSLDAPSIDEVDLTVYLGPARVATLGGGEGISAVELAPILASRPERLIVRCHPGFDPERFPERIRFFTPEAATALGRAGVRLIGVDAPSVDPIDSKDLPAHRAFGRAGVAILENLLLGGVPDGDYELVALPLRIAGGDASPVRAVLRSAKGEV